MASKASPRFELWMLIIFLVVAGAGLTAYKAMKLGFPLMPGEYAQFWTVEAKISLNARGEPLIVSLALPQNSPYLQVVERTSIAPGFGFGRQTSENQIRGVWSRRDAKGEQVLYYQVEVSRTWIKGAFPDPPPVPVPEKPSFEEEYQQALKAFLTEVRRDSANRRTFASELLRRLQANSASRQIGLTELLHSDSYDEVTGFAVDLLALEGIPARVARGIYLEDGQRRQPVVTFLEIYDGDEWVFFDPESGEMGLPANYLPWQRGGKGLLEVIGGQSSEIEFSTLSELRPATRLAVERGEKTHAPLIDFSIYSLPVENQNAFRLLLLVPVGALVVVIMRNLVGVRTSGTFMPILIALSFLRTELLPGLTIFILIVSAGLLIRGYLSRLNLLLVPRISAVVIVVILLMAMLSVLSFKLGVLTGLTVTFFPMVVLAWTIERMSILWEEDGAKEVLIQGGGSLLVALLGYLAMDNRFVQNLTFSFPELLLVVLACILLIGQYRGYRLSELLRFKQFMEEG